MTASPHYRRVLARAPFWLILLPSLLIAAASLLIWPPTEWDAPLSAAVIIVAAAACTRVTVFVRGGFLSGDLFMVMLLAAIQPPSAAILGAVAAVATQLIFGVKHRERDWQRESVNMTATVIPVALGALALAYARSHGLDIGSATYGFLVIAVFSLTIVVNFVLTFLPDLDEDGQTMRELVKDILIPLAPQQFLIACAVGLAVALFDLLGAAGMALGAVILLGFQWMACELMASKERARDLESYNLSVLHSLINSISLRDGMTARHSLAVAMVAQEIALEMGEDPKWVEQTLGRAGFLHDIGKLLLTDHILKGSERLTDEEFDLVKQHSAAGEQLVRGLPGHDEIATIIRHHHEKWAGGGYPDGIAGEEIPLGSRCIAVGDVFDVLTQRDTYREPITEQETVEELLRSAGTQLDPDCVQAFIRVLDKKGDELRARIAALPKVMKMDDLDTIDAVPRERHLRLAA